MADEAVLRIVVEEGGRIGPSRETPSEIGRLKEPIAPSTSTQPPAPDDYLVAEAKAALQVTQKQQTAAAAQEKREEKLLELEAKATLDVIRKKEKGDKELYELQLAAAQRAVKAEIELEDKERKLVEIEAQAALKALRKRQKEEEEALPEALPVFDPRKEARKRREAERKRAQVRAAYKKEYGEKGKSPFDDILKVADSLRGTIGGVTGTTVGALLDVVSGLRKAQKGVERDKKERDLLSEAVEPATTKAAEPIESTRKSVETAEVAVEDAKKLGTRESVETARKAIEDARKAVEAVKTTKAAEGVSAKGAGAMEEAGAMEGAGAAGGIGELAGAIVPIVGIAVAVKEALKQLREGVMSSIRAMGDFTAAVVSSDENVANNIGRLGEGAKAVGDKLFDVAPVVSIFVSAIGEGATQLGRVMKELDKSVERYGEYSPVIAQAQAVAEIRQTMGDLRRAQEVGKTMAQYVMAQSDLQQKFEDIKVKLMVKIIPIITRILEVLEFIMPSGEGIENAINALLAPLKAIPGATELIALTLQENMRPPIDDPTSILFKEGGEGVLVPHR